MLPVVEVADEAVKEDVTEEILRIINTEPDTCGSKLCLIFWL